MAEGEDLPSEVIRDIEFRPEVLTLARNPHHKIYL